MQKIRPCYLTHYLRHHKTYKSHILQNAEFSTARNCRISRVGMVHHSENAESHAQEGSTTRKMQNPTRGNGPPLRKCRIPRAGKVHRSENAESHAQEGSTARKMQNPTRGSRPPLGNRRIPRAGVVH